MELKKLYWDSFGYKHLEQDGGGEGGAEDCEGVFKLGGKYYHTTWRYYSHHGYEYDGIVGNLSLVTPSQKTVTVYN